MSEEIQPVPPQNGEVKNRSHLFKPGNKIAAGRSKKYNKEVHVLRKALYDTLTYHDMVVIWKKIIWKAKRGDSRAYNTLLDRAFGKAVTAMEISVEDAGDNIKSMTTEDLMRLAVGSDN